MPVHFLGKGQQRILAKLSAFNLNSVNTTLKKMLKTKKINLMTIKKINKANYEAWKKKKESCSFLP